MADGWRISPTNGARLTVISDNDVKVEFYDNTTSQYVVTYEKNGHCGTYTINRTGCSASSDT